MTPATSNVKHKQVLLVSNLYRPNIGGVENSLYHLAEAFEQRGFTVTVLASDIHNGTDPLPVKQVVGATTILRYPVHQKSRLRRWFAHFWEPLKLMTRLRRSSAFELVLVRYHWLAIVLWLAGFRNIQYLVPGVVTHQNKPSQLGSNSGAWIFAVRQLLNYGGNIALQRLALRLSHRIHVFSNTMAQQVIEEVRAAQRKLYICKPGVDMERFKPGDQTTRNRRAKALGIPLDVTTFICIGRFVRAKGFDLAIEALAGVADAHLILVGSGVEEEHYRKLIKKFCLESKVSLIPATQEPERYYQLADVFLFTSRYEPLGQTLLEALATGLPILSFKPGDVDTAIEDVMGKANWEAALSSESLADMMNQAIVQIKSGESSAISQSNRKLAMDKYTWDALGQHLLSPASEV